MAKGEHMSSGNYSYKVDKQFKSIEETPLSWFNFTKYCRCPVEIVATLYNMSTISGSVFDNTFNTVLYAFYAIGLFFDITFMVGTWDKKMKRYAYTAKMYSLLNNCIFYCGFALILQTETIVVSFLCMLFVAYLEYVYYKKRELLFSENTNIETNCTMKKVTPKIETNNTIGKVASKVTGLKTKIATDNEEPKDIVKVENHKLDSTKYSATQEQPKRIMYCRKCGTKLLEDSKFCRICGCKVESE